MIFFYGEIKRYDSPYSEVLKKSFVLKKNIEMCNPKKKNSSKGIIL